MLLVTVALVACTAWLYTVVPKGFFPDQDTGLLIGTSQAAADTSFRAMLPLPSEPEQSLGGMPVMIISGRMDPILPLDNAKRLAEALREHGAVVDHRVLETGHGMTRNDVDLARGFIAGING